MADIADVERQMVAVIAASLGLSAPYDPLTPVVSPVVGTVVKISRGWPVTKQLELDLAAGMCIATIFPINAQGRRTTRYFTQWNYTAPVTPTLTATAANGVVSFGGTGGVGQVAGIRFGPEIGGAAYAYRLNGADTPTSVATAFAALIPDSMATGASLELPTALYAEARVAADQPAWTETRRQLENISVVCWCPNPTIRDLFASVIDAGFANMTDTFGRLTEMMPLPDGSVAWLRYAASRTDDMPQQARLWRRDLRYLVEYPTTLLEQQPEVLFGGGVINAGQGDPAGTTYGDLQPAILVEVDVVGDVAQGGGEELIGIPPD